MRGIKTIESFGLPGSGKSTCIKKVKELNQNPALTVLLRKNGGTKTLDKVSPATNKYLSLIYQNYIILSYLIIRPVYFYNVLKSLILFKFNRHFIYSLRNLIEAQYCYSMYVENKTYSPTLLLDEGLVQYLGALAVNVPNENGLPEAIVAHTLKNYIKALVFFEIDIHNSINRIINRNDGKSRFDSMSQQDKIVNLKRMQTVFDQCLKVAKKTDINVLKVDGCDTIKNNYILILNNLNN